MSLAGKAENPTSKDCAERRSGSEWGSLLAGDEQDTRNPRATGTRGRGLCGRVCARSAAAARARHTHLLLRELGKVGAAESHRVEDQRVGRIAQLQRHGRHGASSSRRVRKVAVAAAAAAAAAAGSHVARDSHRRQTREARRPGATSGSAARLAHRHGKQSGPQHVALHIRNKMLRAHARGCERVYIIALRALREDA